MGDNKTNTWGNDPTIYLWEILVPTVRNDGRFFTTKYHKVWDKKVYELTGGLTIVQPVKGKWMNDGIIYDERNIPVRIACTRDTIYDILEFTKKYYDQIAVMAFRVSDEVIIK